jgi:hypothetical protein
MSSQSTSNIDSVLTYILIKKLITPITKTDAYKLGLINNAGKVIKSPSSAAEENSLTILDRLILKIKRLLGTKLINLQKFLYIVSLHNNFYNNIIVKGNVSQRSEIKRLNNDIDKLMESYNISFDDYMILSINEHLQTQYGDIK